MLVTPPEWLCSSVVLDALSHLQHERTTVAINKSLQRARGNKVIEEHFRSRHLHRCVTIPYDEQLAAALDAGHYTLEALQRPTRMAINLSRLDSPSPSSWCDAGGPRTAAARGRQDALSAFDFWL